MTIQELEQFIALYGKDIYSFCVYLAGSEADDLYQDTFLEAVKKKESISKDGNPKSYLLSVSVNLWNNRKRKYARRMRIAPQVGLDIRDTVRTFPDASDTPLKNEEKLKVTEAVMKLKEIYKIPILLYYMEDMSVTQIGRVLSLPEGTVKSRMHKARKILGEELEAYYDND